MKNINKNKEINFNSNICLLKRRKKNNIQLKQEIPLKNSNFVIFLNVKLKLKLKKIFRFGFNNIKKFVKISSNNKNYLSKESKKTIRNLFFCMIKKSYRFKINLAFRRLQSNRYFRINQNQKMNTMWQNPQKIICSNYGGYTQIK